MTELSVAPQMEPKQPVLCAHVRDIEIDRHPSLGGDKWVLKGLTGITTILGKNGSGKSQLLRAWRDQDAQNIHYVAPERGGEMDMQPRLIAQENDGNLRRNNSQRNFTPDYRRRIVARITTYLSYRGNYREEIAPAGPEEIEKHFATLLTDFELRLNPSKLPPYELIRNDSAKAVANVDELSSGEAQLVTLALDILTIAAIWKIQSIKNGVLLVDEPDAHIHPDLQVRFADFICKVAKDFGFQVVVATHSASLLASLGNFGGKEASVIYMSRTKKEYVAQKFDATMREISAILGGHLLMGPLFGAPILLVEGDDDFRIWGQVPRHHHLNLSVVPCGGDDIINYQQRIESVLASMTSSNETIGYALRDGDKNLPQPTPARPQDKIRFIGLACLEAENLYLTNEVLSDMGIDWAVAREKLSQVSGYGSKNGGLRALVNIDRKKDDIKNYINELANILDEKKLHWTVRVGKALGRQTPTGELRDFLGDQVVKALWG